ncbi:hypothetical protein PR048_008211 [Dryococelus australis]|uniref:Uncharacterized protein n=1 Tax=Dryococelus australis TaxID=614101 RepID=A0ABQ9HWG6_9NEOP|nr:hypothetical protein PR048_008211 [Dryococelus australis]
MSRMPLPETGEDQDILGTVYIISVNLPMSDTRLIIFQKETILCNSHVEDKILFLGRKIAVPTALRPYVLNLVHKEHGGLEKTKARARHCRSCEKFRRVNQRESLSLMYFQDYHILKWALISLEDAGNALLMQIDYYIHWLDI